MLPPPSFRPPMPRLPRPARVALAVTAAGVLLAVGAAWRVKAVRAGFYGRVETRLGQTAALARDGVEFWLRERVVDARTAVRGAESSDGAADLRVLDALREGQGYAGIWVLQSGGRQLGRSGGAGPLTPRERAVSDSVLGDGRQRACAPYPAATGSGWAVCVAAAVPARDGALRVVVLRVDPATTLYPLATATALRGTTEVGELVLRAGDTLFVVPPASGEGHAGVRILRAEEGGPLRGREGDVEGLLPADRFAPATLAGLRTVRGTSWSVLRRVEVREIDGRAADQLTTEALLLASALVAVGLGIVAAGRSARAERLREQAEAESRAAAELERERSLLHTVLEATADGLVAADRTGNVTTYNQRLVDLWGVDAGQLTDRPIVEIGRLLRDRVADPEAWDAAVARVDLASLDDHAATFSLRDGRVLERVARPQIAHGEVVGRVWCFRDITERERALQALRAAEASARALVDHAPSGICRVSRDGRMLVANPALLAMLGHADARALASATMFDLLVDPADFVALRDGALAEPDGRRAVPAGAPPSVGGADREVRMRRRDGREFPAQVHARAVRDDGGAVRHFECYVVDLAPLRDAEHALRQAEKLAAVGRVVSGVAHELNNPLSAVLLFADGLLESGQHPEERETLTLIREQAWRARAIVRDLLTFVREVSGTREVLAAADVVSRVGRALALQAEAEGAFLALDIPESLGWVDVDRAAIEQVLANLVLNALQAAPRSTVRLTARVEGAEREEPGRLVIAVEDDGPGIAPEVMARLFEPFFTTKPEGVGTGLGLSVSLGIATRHGGTLTAGNRAPHGARFTLALPRATAPAVRAEPVATAGHTAPVTAAVAAAPPGRPAASGRRVLIVDDEPPVRSALVRYFTRRGWTVEEAGDGGAALDRIAARVAAVAGSDELPFALILSDLRMPGLSGAAFHDEIARRAPSLLARLAFSTGDVVSEEAAAFVARTRCPVLEKPYELATLDALVARVLEAADAADAARADAVRAEAGAPIARTPAVAVA